MKRMFPFMVGAMVMVGTDLAHADANQGAYAGAGVGRYDVHIDDATELGNTIRGYREADTAYKIFVGWRFMPYLAIEGDYINLGTNRDNVGPGVQVTNKIYGWAPSLVGTLPLGPFELFVKGGEYWYQYKRSVDTPVGSSGSSSDTFNHFLYSGGVGFVIADRIPLRLEYEEYHIQQTDRSNALWLTAAYRF